MLLGEYDLAAKTFKKEFDLLSVENILDLRSINRFKMLYFMSL